MDAMQLLSSWIHHICDLGLYLLWRFMHILLSLWYIVLDIDEKLERYLTSLGYINPYCPIDVGKIRNLAIVMDTENAFELLSVVDLIQWLRTIEVKHACLFDSEGLMKMFETPIKYVDAFESLRLSYRDGRHDSSPHQNHIRLEFLSSSDNKEALVKAANLLFEEYLDSTNLEDDKAETIFTEANLTEALTGESRHEPDLLLVYGPVRCHNGFPAWRLRYTEIVHMGPLKDMRYDSFLKAINNFTKVHQNYDELCCITLTYREHDATNTLGLFFEVQTRH